MKTRARITGLEAIPARLWTQFVEPDGVLSTDALDVAIRALSLVTVVTLSLTGYGRGVEEGQDSLYHVNPLVISGALIIYNLLVVAAIGVPWKRPPGFLLFTLDWVVASAAIILTGGLFSPFVVLYCALAIGSALRVGLARSLMLVAACSVCYLGLSLVVPVSLEPARLPVLSVMVTSLVMMSFTAVSMKHAVEVEQQRVKLEEEAAARLRLLNHLQRAVWSASPDMVSVMRTVASVSAKAVSSDRCLVILFTEAIEPGATGTDTYSRNLLMVSDSDPDPFQLSPYEQELANRMTSTGRPVVISEKADRPQAWHQPEYRALSRDGQPVCAIAGAPFSLEDRVLGALLLVRYSPGPFSAAEVDFLQGIAQQLSVAVRLSRLYEREHEKAMQSEERERMERDLLSVVSHDMRTPLTAIKACADVLANMDPDEAESEPSQDPPSQETLQFRERLVSNIGRNTDRLIALVDELLDMARLREGRVALNLQRINLGDVVREVAGQISPLLDTKGQYLSLDLPGESSGRWGALEAKADRRRIEQVLQNLLSNAHKYAPEGGIITVGATPRHGQVKVFVRDQGPGIAPRERALIFEKFYRGAASMESGRGKESLGLGLAIAQAIIELHRGQMGVQSSPGHGSTFYFTLRSETSDNEATGNEQT